MSIKLRKWQAEAADYLIHFHQEKQAHLFSASGGGGKTIFSCACMVEMRRFGYARFIAISPSYSVKKGFADSAARFGIQLDCNGQSIKKGFHGLSLTYAALRNCGWLAKHVGSDTMVILDEPHHLEDDKDSAWYQDALRVIGGAGLIVMMTGTPWRSGGKGRIPFCTYDKISEREWEIKPDFTYSYSEALADNVVARVRFRLCKGVARWMDNDGDHEIRVGEDGLGSGQEGKALRALTTVGGDYYDGMLGDALAKLGEIRDGENNYAMLVVARDVEHARETVKRLREKFGINAALAVGDDTGSHKVIEEFRESRRQVIVSVLQISEGTDIPRVKIILYASSYMTYLFFCQVMFRGCRKTMRQRQEFYMFIPALPTFTMHVRLIEEEVTHVVKEVEEKVGLDEVSEGGAFPQTYFEAGDSEYLEAEAHEIRSYEEFTDAPLTDRQEDLRRECAELAKQFAAKFSKTADDTTITETMRAVHVQANEIVGVAKQEDMSVEQLASKARILKTWLGSKIKKR